MIYGVIYKITNLINKKSYIGQTKKNIKERLNGHFNSGKKSKNTKLYKAICKYGVRWHHGGYTWKHKTT